VSKRTTILAFTIFFLLAPFSFSHAKSDDPTSNDLGGANCDTFSIVWISDTQDMAYMGYGHPLESMGKWIMDNRRAHNIRYVVQTGDAVDNGASPWQWERYDELYHRIKGKIPYLSAAGNHEVKKNGYLEYLARPEVRGLPPENTFEKGEASFATLGVNGRKFIIVAVGYGIEQNAVPWVNSVLHQHGDHTAILLFHDYMQSNGRFSKNGKSMFEQVVVPNPNVRLVLCGHVCGVSSRIDPIDDDHDGAPDRTVAQMMYNYQHFKADCGQLRLMEFHLDDRSITVTTYSPFTQRYYRDYMFGDRAVFTLKDGF
jgi:predicted MPP superfamily phosphohydrolase